MHPQYRSDRPGDAPCCGMRLEPVYAGGGSVKPESPIESGVVEISGAKQQLMGVRMGEVARAGFTHAMRYPGRVAVDETRVYRWNAAVDGWIREISNTSTGSLVKKGETLAAYYAPEFLGAQQAYLYALGAMDRFQATGKETPAQIQLTKANIQQAADSLRNMGMSDAQVEEMASTRQLTERVRILAPVTGFILSRNVSPGQRFDRGSELYRFADFGHVWVMADVFEKDRELIRPGAAATIRYQERGFPARMSDVLPQFDQSTRTLKTRFELDNPELVLRPGMFVDVELEVRVPSTLHIPVEAILDSGARKTVYVDRGSGFFEPRQVATGWRLGDRIQITQGLEAGDRIVVSGNFLVDSESRIRSAAAGTPPAVPVVVRAGTETEKDAVCGMDVDAKNPKALKTQHGGKTYYFCSQDCKQAFEQNLEKYLPKPKPSDREARGARGPA